MPQKNNSAADCSFDGLSTVDVYDLASSIGNQFEKLIDSYGSECVSGLMPIVIRVLEQLEDLTARSEEENAQLDQLRGAVEVLEAEKKFKAEERSKYEKELEFIEETWKNEAKLQREVIMRLQDENRKLNAVVRDKASGVESFDITNRERELEEEVERLKALMQKQREDNRLTERELSQRNLDFESLQSQVGRMTKQTVELKRRMSITQKLAQNVIEEKAELQALLHESDRQLNSLRMKVRRQDSSEATSSPSEREKLERQLSTEGKMVIDLNDPNHPRFTLTELRDVLHERNELKTKITTLEEELQQYKPEMASTEQGPELEEDPPVQGPINKEPDEKLYPERFSKESRIRKLFKYFFSSSKEPKASASRDSSSLRKGSFPTFKAPPEKHSL